MNSILWIIIVTIFITALLSCILIYFYMKSKEKYLMHWSMGWLTVTFRLIIEILLLYHVVLFALILVAKLLLLTAVVFFLMGSVRYSGKSIKKEYYYFGVVLVAVTIVLYPLGYTWAHNVISAYSGILMLACGLLILFSSGKIEFGRVFTALAIMLLFVHQFASIAYFSDDWFIPWKLVMFAIFTFLIGLGQVIIFFENILKHQSGINEQLVKKEKELEMTLKVLEIANRHLSSREKLAGLGQMSAGIAHEINNPLGFVMSNQETLNKYIEKVSIFLNMCHNYIQKESENIEGALSSDKSKELLEFAKRQKINYVLEDLSVIMKDTYEGLNRIRHIVMSLKSFAMRAKMDAFEKFNLNEGIKNTIDIARNELKHSADLKINLGEIPDIEANPGEINQVILNLIINSIHAIKEKGLSEQEGLISISTWGKDNEVVCKVEDNGIGIPDEIRDKVFEPFFTTKGVGQGTGLGLSISYDIIVNKHRGEIVYGSVCGEGTEFIIKLPVKHIAKVSDEKY